VILNGIFGALAVASFLTTLWQWLAARRFPLHRRTEPTPAPSTGGEKTSAHGQPVPLLGGVRGGSAPAVTLLKPLKGADEFTESCLRSWLAQEYNGEIQTLFGVDSADDPACAVVKKLVAEFPRCDAQLVVCPERLGANAKVSKLAQLEPSVKHEIVVVSDADVRVPSDLLANLVSMLSAADQPTPDPSQEGSYGRASADLIPSREGSGVGSSSPCTTNGGAHGVTRPTCETVGLVNCFYRFANPTTPAMQWEAIAVNADFWSQVLQGASIHKLDFALGAVMATKRKVLAEIGGFRALLDYLADDYQLGNRIACGGRRIEICPVVTECWSPPMGWGEVWRHQLRWARTIRRCVPASYFFSIVGNATLWPLLWALTASPLGLICAAVFFLARLLVAEDLQRRLTPSHSQLSNFWLVPVKDLLQAALWVGAFTGNHVEWRGERYRLRRDGTLTKE
jgi:ceramide glucosyltransferase